MAGDVNVVTVVGRLTRDPETRTLQSGSTLCSMRVAVNERVKFQDQWQDRANFFDVTAWGGLAENCSKYLEKGRQVAVSGRLRWREWDASDGGKRQAVDIHASDVQFLGDGQRRQEERQPEAAPAPDIPF